MSVKEKNRFEFGKNWAAFLSTLNDKRIQTAEESLSQMLKLSALNGKSFIDIGSGSGLFSLSARKLGAKVFSFDYDRDSVRCTQELKDRYFAQDSQWLVEQGSILDTQYLSKFDKFDIVYSWGVLHHTGNMWQAIDNAASLVKDDGLFFIAIYNDQAHKSKRWHKVKKTFNQSSIGRLMVLSMFIPYFFGMALLNSILKRRNLFKEYKQNRGMSVYHDWVDWLGGFPFEVASVGAILDYLQPKGYTLIKVKTNLGLGCNEFVFKKNHNIL
jgi:2-polyprenyl-6-hydroxyphenyl methylase/3-demethylubiquinone-9 3-methyltransferase